MTKDEFNDFSNRLFVTYPATYAWLQDKSPDIKATLESWFRRLSKFDAVDCQVVLDRWEETNAEPWKAYDRENVPAVIASCVYKLKSDRERTEQAANMAREVNEARQRRTGGFDITAHFDGDMVAVFNELLPYAAKVWSGELMREDYEPIKERIMAKLDRVEPVAAGDFAEWSL